MTASDARPPSEACNCHTYGHARLCPVHTQADYDAAELTRERPPSDTGTTLAFIRALVNAWDCCGTCAGGVLAARDRERDARLAALAGQEQP